MGAGTDDFWMAVGVYRAVRLFISWASLPQRLFLACVISFTGCAAGSQANSRPQRSVPSQDTKENVKSWRDVFPRRRNPLPLGGGVTICVLRHASGCAPLSKCGKRRFLISQTAIVGRCLSAAQHDLSLARQNGYDSVWECGLGEVQRGFVNGGRFLASVDTYSKVYGMVCTA